MLPVKKKRKSLSDMTLTELDAFCKKYIKDCKACPLKKIMKRGHWELEHCIKGYCFYLLGFNIEKNMRSIEFVKTYKIDEKEI